MGTGMCCSVWGRNQRRAGSRAVPDCPEQPPRQQDLSLTHLFSFAHLACLGMASQDPRGERGQGPHGPSNPSLCPKAHLGLSSGWFFLFSGLTQHLLPQPPLWAQPSTSVPKEGPVHAMMHTPRTTGAQRARWLCRMAASQEMFYGAQVKQVKGPGVPARAGAAADTWVLKGC